MFMALTELLLLPVVCAAVASVFGLIGAVRRASARRASRSGVVMACLAVAALGSFTLVQVFSGVVPPAMLVLLLVCAAGWLGFSMLANARAAQDAQVPAEQTVGLNDVAAGPWKAPSD